MPGRIQAHGFLVVIRPDDFVIVQASENTHILSGIPVQELIGKRVDALLANTNVNGSSLLEIINVALRNRQPDSLNPYRLEINNEPANIILHVHDGALVLEFEPTDDLSNGFLLQQRVAQALADVQASRTMDELLNSAARKVKDLTGYDRVMIYRFSEDWHGHVVAEEKEDHLEPFLGLHYPASDIPRQARELYKINLVRCITDVNQESIPIYPVLYADRKKPFDLTHSVLRAVSPIHIEYLKNMGVQSSMSISLMYRGELWGLIACHHYSPRFIDYPTRMSAKFIAQLLSASLEFRKNEDDLAFWRQIRNQEQVLQEQMLRDWDIKKGLLDHPVTALDINSAIGVAVSLNGEVHTLGKTPSPEQVKDIIEWIKLTSTDTILQTSQLPNLMQGAETYREVASGLLVIELSRELDEYILWFKPERITQVDWAGNPDKPVTVDASGEARISPRKSFEKWTQEVRNQSEPWREVEIATALKLREDILQIINQKANHIRILNEQLRVAYEELDAFSYTVSHDLRTPLSSVKSYSEIILEEYSDELNDDVQDLLNKIIAASDRMTSLIRNILHYSRMGRTELNAQMLDMASMLTILREEIVATEKSRALQLIIKNTPPVYGDHTMVLQIFSNLLSNAVKYTRDKQPAIVIVDGIEHDREVTYSVQDNGIGIDMRQAGKMFELFKRLENAQDYEGSGVGLAILKRILGRHNGKVWFDSEPNRQTTFYVSFPKPVQSQ
ncbi:histidine kinase [Arsenicibacter rosenii]|uniref:histidine kinase n=2 Tax=Arsenicibacter rosenii TaxID=1750698 RepID=A0A1S2VHJ4_9BACT|nr:histidine kinase [Arsenicibacter rosenii]